MSHRLDGHAKLAAVSIAVTHGPSTRSRERSCDCA